VLAEPVVEWTQRWKEEGLRAGRAEGLQQGLQQGQLQEARTMVLSVMPTRINSRAIGAGESEHVNARQPGPYSVSDARHGRNSDATATLRGSPVVKGRDMANGFAVAESRPGPH